MHVLVTGGAGFIGAHVVRLLLSERHRLTIVDNLSGGLRTNVPRHAGVTLIEKDLLNFPVSEWPRDIDAIIHLAARPSVLESWAQLRQAHEINLSATVRALEAARELRVDRFIFASSAAVYGDPTAVPVQENASLQPLSPYGLQKLAGEHYGRLVANESGLRFIALRFFNVFGPGQDPASPYSGVISRFMAAMGCNGGAVTVRGDGRQTRDFVFVKDVARAVSAALQAAVPRAGAFTCNIGSGTPTAILDLARVLRELHPDWRGTLEFAPPAHGEIRHSAAEIMLAQTRLRFTPRWSLRAGLEAMIADPAMSTFSERL